MAESQFNFDAAPWDLRTFKGRLKYFFWVTDPRSCLVDDATLDNAKQIRDLYKKGQEPKDVKMEQVLRAKKLYESAFHPDTGEKQNIFGRMCFQMPGGMAITGVMLSFYRTNTAVVFWQWVNQSFNAMVNYTNRNANSPLTNVQMGAAYTSATVAACFTAIKLKSFLAKQFGPFLQRYIPFAAVATANCVNIPLMRQNEITKGIDVLDDRGNKMGTSKVAAIKGISQVVLSRIVMCAPGMLLLPVIMESLCNRSHWIRKNTWFHAPFQIVGVGCFLMVMVPTACAIYPQLSEIKVATLQKVDPECYEEIVKNSKGIVPAVVYYNKGL